MMTEGFSTLSRRLASLEEALRSAGGTPSNEEPATTISFISHVLDKKRASDELNQKEMLEGLEREFKEALTSKGLDDPTMNDCPTIAHIAVMCVEKVATKLLAQLAIAKAYKSEFKKNVALALMEVAIGPVMPKVLCEKMVNELVAAENHYWKAPKITESQLEMRTTEKKKEKRLFGIFKN